MQPRYTLGLDRWIDGFRGAKRARWYLYDWYLLPMAGDQVCEVKLYDIAGVEPGEEGRLLIEREIPFRYEPLSGEEYDRSLERIQRSLIGAVWDVASSKMDPRCRFGTWQAPTSPDGQMKEALYYMGDLHDQLYRRVGAYARVYYAVKRDRAACSLVALMAWRCSRLRSGQRVCRPASPVPCHSALLTHSHRALMDSPG